MALPNRSSEFVADAAGAPVIANALLPVADAVTVPLNVGLLTIAIVGVAPLMAATFEPAVSRAEMFWNVGVPDPADVSSWFVDPALVNEYADPVPKAMAPAVGVAVELVPPLAIGKTPLTSVVARPTAELLHM